MTKIWSVLLLLGVATMAGCLDADDGDGGVPGTDCKAGGVDDDGIRLAEPADDVLPVDQDPWSFDARNVRSCSLKAIGWHPLRGTVDEPDPHQYLGEIDMRGDLDLGAVAVLGLGEAPMVYLLDISDRANPEVLSTITQGLTYNVDVKISDDGDHLFVASQNLPTGTGGAPEDPQGASTPWGFTIYDIRDRTAPVFQQTVPTDLQNIGCHMLSHEVIDGTDVVFCVGQQIVGHGFIDNGVGPWVYLGPLPYFLPDGSGAAAPGNCVNDNVLLGVAGAPELGLFCNGPHDMTVAADPVDGKTYMTVSHWNEGLRVVDVSAPIDEGYITVGSWAGEGATHYDGNVHTAMMFWVGDQRYVVATPEMTYGGIVPSFWVLNATELAPGKQLELVAEWYHPSETPTPGLLMTLHQWQVAPTGPDADPADVRIYMTYNHNGVWVLEWEELLAGDLAGAIGGFHMSRLPLDQNTDVSNAILSTWDVNVVDGYIYGSDRATGLWIFHYGPDELGDPTRTGFA